MGKIKLFFCWLLSKNSTVTADTQIDAHDEAYIILMWRLGVNSHDIVDSISVFGITYKHVDGIIEKEKARIKAMEGVGLA